MDAVYILGTGSLANNIEILYSVRSLNQYMLDLGDVYIVGEDPGNLPAAKHVPASDTSDYKWKNAYHKVLKACGIDSISDEFLLMNDDFFMLEPFEGAEYPFYALQGASGGPAGPVSFQIHTPMRIKKEWFAQMPFDTGGKSPRSMRSMYANFYGAPPTYTKDFTMRAGKNARDYKEQIAGQPSFSIGDAAALEPSVIDLLDELYPLPSRFE